MMTVPLIDAMSYGGILILCLIEILGMGQGVVAGDDSSRRFAASERYAFVSEEIRWIDQGRESLSNETVPTNPTVSGLTRAGVTGQSRGVIIASAKGPAQSMADRCPCGSLRSWEQGSPCEYCWLKTI